MRYVCEVCGYESPKWFGRCPVCGSWDSAVEVKESGGKSPPVVLIPIGSGEKLERIKTGFKTLNEILGGGLVKGQVLLLGGEPGVGKSTIALQIGDSVSRYGKVVYASGEESAEQISTRAERLKIEGKNIVLSTTQSVDSLLKTLERDPPKLLIVDSIQTFRSDEIGSIPGGVSQVKTVVSKVIDFSKRSETVSLLIGHITKSGEIAGPKLVEHMVDTVLYFEGERLTDVRVLRVFKNRFGPSGGIALFEMTNGGLIEIEELVFKDKEDLPGNALSCALEGSRALVVQIQALVSKSRIPTPRRNAVGLDQNRLSAVVAVLSKFLKIPFDLREIHVGVLGGLRITDPGVDLGLALAMLSSFLERSVDGYVSIGEIGLDGRVRIPYGFKKRLSVLSKLGFKRIVSPVNVEGFDVKIVESVLDLPSVLRG